MAEEIKDMEIEVTEATAVIEAVETEPASENVAPEAPVVSAVAAPKKKGHKGLIITLVILLLLVAAGFAAFHPTSPLAPIVQSWLAPTPTVAPNTDDEGLLPDEYVVRDAEVTMKVIFSAEGVGIEGVGDEPTALEALVDADKLAAAADALTAGSLDSTSVTLDLKLTGFEYPLPDGLTDPAQVEAFATQYAQLQERVAELEGEGIIVECLPCTGSIALLPGSYEVSPTLFVVDAQGHVWRLADPIDTLMVDGDMELTLTYKAVDLTSTNVLQLSMWADDARMAGLNAAADALTAAIAVEEEEEETPGTSGGSSGTRPGTRPGNGGGNGGGGTVAPPAGHTHTWGATEYHVTSPGHYETVNHPAEYNKWSEAISVCATCKANITGHAADHCAETGHSGWYTDYIYHSELIKEAWSEEVWVEERGFYFHRCKTCGESEEVIQ